MAYHSDSPIPGPPEGAFTGTHLSPDELERFASAFRPSWELDDAPFTGAAPLSASDIRALQGGGTHADVRATLQATANGSHAASQAPGPDKAVVNRALAAVDRALAGAEMATPPPPVGTGPVPPVQRAPAVAMEQTARPQPIVRPPRMQAPVAPVQALSRELEDSSSYVTRSRKPLWLGLAGTGVAALIAIGVWAASGGESDKSAVTPSANVESRPRDNTPAIPPPPTQAATATPVQSPPAPPPPAPVSPPVSAPATATATATAAATAAMAPPPPPTIPAAALPPAPQHAAVVARPVPVYTPPPKPVAHPTKGGTNATIVRDVPF